MFLNSNHVKETVTTNFNDIEIHSKEASKTQVYAEMNQNNRTQESVWIRICSDLKLEKEADRQTDV